jgi:hypothetical protein
MISLKNFFGKKTFLFFLIICAKLVIIIILIQPMITGKTIYEINNSPIINISSEVLTLGFCPTMNVHAQKLAQEKSYDLLPLTSTSQAFHALNNGEVDIILVGRMPISSELVFDYYLAQLHPGQILIANNHQTIYFSQLSVFTIHTNIDISKISPLFPKETTIIYYENATQAIHQGLKQNNFSAVLLTRNDLPENYNLVIVLNSDNTKNKDFRIPLLFSKNTDLSNIFCSCKPQKTSSFQNIAACNAFIVEDDGCS